MEGNRTDQYSNGVYRICDLNGDGDASTVAITKKNSEYAPTMIRITYYSEESKSYGVFTIPIYTKAKKFKM